MMNTYTTLWIMLLCLSISACGNQDRRRESIKSDAKVQVQDRQDNIAWFAELSDAIDKIAGPRFQSMQMMGMHTHNYQTQSSVAEVLAQVEEMIAQQGFERIGIDHEIVDATKEMSKTMPSMKMNMHEMVTFKGKSGYMLSFTKMTIDINQEETQSSMTLMTVQLMNPGSMSKRLNKKLLTEVE